MNALGQFDFNASKHWLSFAYIYSWKTLNGHSYSSNKRNMYLEYALKSESFAGAESE